MPSAARAPPTAPTTPRPETAAKSRTSSSASERAAAAPVSAAASGCSLPRSRLAATRNSVASSMPGSGTSAARLGFPSVSVPVLSSASMSTCRSRSIASASRNNTPAFAPRPIATRIDMGVARPSAHGHAMMSTETAATTACARAGSGPKRAHSANASTAHAMTAGTNTAATRSARFWIGARLRCALATSATMRASKVSLPTRSAATRSVPDWFRVAPITRAPACFSTGSASPETSDSSTELAPSSTRASTGTFSPGRTRRRSPTCTCDSGTSSSAPSARTRRANAGASESSARSAAPVRRRARSSSTCPSSTSTTITAADSK